MAQHHRIADPELIERVHQQSCLSCCGPYSEPGPLTIAKARAKSWIMDPLPEQHDARSRRIAPIDIMEYYAIPL